MTESTPKKKVAPTATTTKASAKVKSADKAAKESTAKKATTSTAMAPSATDKVTSTAKAAADKATSVFGGFSLPAFSIPKVDLPKIDVPNFDLPKVELPKVDVPDSVASIADRGSAFVQDSVRSAHQTADSVRKNISQTVVLVREAVGI